jgi:tRNA(fMet)-specific endonuclease VapC
VSDPEGLLDTSAVLALPRLRDASLLPDVALISAVTLAELAVGLLVATDETERARRLAHVQQAEADFDPLPFDAPAARAFALVASAYRRSGRKPAARAFDEMIAATAIANGLPLYTANPGDFAGIDDLVIRTIPTP